LVSICRCNRWPSLRSTLKTKDDRGTFESGEIETANYWPPFSSQIFPSNKFAAKIQTGPVYTHRQTHTHTHTVTHFDVFRVTSIFLPRHFEFPTRARELRSREEPETSIPVVPGQVSDDRLVEITAGLWTNGRTPNFHFFQN
jgi:hypothetical protein